MAFIGRHYNVNCMPPYTEIQTILTNYYAPNSHWRDQWDLIKQMAWLADDYSAYSTNRITLGNAIKNGVRGAYRQQQIPIPSNQDLSKIKENTIKDIESFRSTPEFWQNIR